MERRTTFSIDDGLDKAFRKAITERMGFRRGAFKKAITQAIRLWMDDTKKKGGPLHCAVCGKALGEVVCGSCQGSSAGGGVYAYQKEAPAEH